MKKRLKRKSNSILNVNDICVNYDYVHGALENITFGRISQSEGQPLEIWKAEDGNLVLINGYHRFVEGILKGLNEFDVIYVEYDDENKEYIDEYNPSAYDFLNKNSKYRGLEDFKSEEELDELASLLLEG
ncbi:gp111 [Bacillus phage G]|uniref:Gp111 n=1 Tax=Bacillus phage G TaxID=2884420 RepID=G3MBH3_9CAUD|nr:gp111 [Bacillus phage G]AEO93373.1 gp111 [Bacillus phage G]